MQQLNGVDCGVAVVAHALRRLCDYKDELRELNSTAWRTVLAIVMGMAGKTLSSAAQADITQFYESIPDLESQLAQVHEDVSADPNRTNSREHDNRRRIQHMIHRVPRDVEAYEKCAASLQAKRQVLSDSSQALQRLYTLATPQLAQVQATESQIMEMRSQVETQIKNIQISLRMMKGTGFLRSRAPVADAEHVIVY